MPKVGRPRKRKRDDDDGDYDFEEELKKNKVEVVTIDRRTRVKHLKALLKRSNFYANSLLTIITEQQKKHEVRTRRKLKKRRKQMKKIESQILKYYGKRYTEIPTPYRYWLKSEEDQVSFGEKICFRVARTCSHLVKKVHRMIKFDKYTKISSSDNADIKQMADMFSNNPQNIFETIGKTGSTMDTESVISYRVIQNTSTEIDFVHSRDSPSFEENVIEEKITNVKTNSDDFKSCNSISSDSESDSDDRTSMSSKPSNSSKSSFESRIDGKIVDKLLHDMIDSICVEKMPLGDPSKPLYSSKSDVENKMNTKIVENLLQELIYSVCVDKVPLITSAKPFTLTSSIESKINEEIVEDLLNKLLNSICSEEMAASHTKSCEHLSNDDVNTVKFKFDEEQAVDKTPDPKSSNYTSKMEPTKCRRHIDMNANAVLTSESHIVDNLIVNTSDKFVSKPATDLAMNEGNFETESEKQLKDLSTNNDDIIQARIINIVSSPKFEGISPNENNSCLNSQSSQTSNSTTSKVPCPVCCKLMSENKINEHLDICLSGGERRESLRASTPAQNKMVPRKKRATKKSNIVTNPDVCSSDMSNQKATQEIIQVGSSMEREETFVEHCIKSPVCKRRKRESISEKEETSGILENAKLKYINATSCNLPEACSNDKKKDLKFAPQIDSTCEERFSEELVIEKDILESSTSVEMTRDSLMEDVNNGVPDLDDLLGYGEEPEAIAEESSDEEEFEFIPPTEVRRSTRASRCRKSFKEYSDEEADEEEDSDEELVEKREKILSKKQRKVEEMSNIKKVKEKKQKTKDMYSVGDIIEVKWGKDESMVLYKAKILDRCPTDDDDWTYLVHYIGWSDSFDDWILTSDINSVIESFDEDCENSSSALVPGSDEILTEEDKRVLDGKFYMPGSGKSAPKSMLKEKNGVRYYNDIEVSAAQPKLFTGGVLRDYQITGYEWMKTLLENSENGILADEMGLGKTIQCIAIVARMIETGITGPFLICAPMSTIQNWFLEFKRFAPKIPLLLYHGTAAERGTLSLCMVQREKKLKTKPVVITTYDVLMRDRMVLQVHSWSYMIIDEGHRIKNLKCKLLKELKYIECQARLLLTGTPLQNNLSELWSLLNFLLPEVFDDLRTFETWFDLDRLQKDKNLLSMIHKILTPFLLRRMKCDVDLKIPPKKELTIYAPLTSKQERFYRALVDKSIFELMHQKEYYQTTIGVADPDLIAQKQNSQELLPGVSFMKRRSARTKGCIIKNGSTQRESIVSNMSMSNIIMQLRKCCNHPYLIEYPIETRTENLRIDEDLICTSGKLRILDQLLPELKKRGHKVLLFSQMTKMLDILQDYCELRGYYNVRIDGQMGRDERVKSMNDFTIDPEIFLFLLSTRAGGLGINLTAADTVILYDSDWNPQNDAQAQDRCHRIGQVRPVVVYRLITASTVDQQIVERASKKLALEKVIMHKTLFKGNLEQELTDKARIHPEELLHLLQSSKESSDKDDNSSGILSKEEVDKLLDRSDMWKSMESL
ncbi:uncharacterized protein LOC120348389 [Styela clava]|uniref:lymphocyte-specific helicase-like n=1 Tax=Styela clava TaxID=7725 RepID=UPI00193A0CF7|nr:lymphocyte-specific helicase-like [Styela clava]